MRNIVPKVLAKGTLNEEQKSTSYFIMPKFDIDMQTYLDSFTGFERAQKVILSI